MRLTSRDYGNSVRAFAAAMKKADPSIKLMSSFPTKALLDAAGTIFDYLCPHQYEIADLASEERNFRSSGRLDCGQRRRQGHSCRGDRVEHHRWRFRPDARHAPDAGQCAQRFALLESDAALRRLGGDCQPLQLRGQSRLRLRVRPAPAGFTSHLPITRRKCTRRAAGAYPLRLERSSQLAWHLQEPDLSASVSADGKKLRIYAVNSTLDPLPRNFQLEGFKAGVAGGAVLTLEDHAHAGTSEVMNSRDNPQRVSLRSQPAELRGTRFEFTFSPLTDHAAGIGFAALGNRDGRSGRARAPSRCVADPLSRLHVGCVGFILDSIKRHEAQFAWRLSTPQRSAASRELI